MPDITLLDLSFAFLQAILGKLKSQLPAELATAAQAAVDAWAAHKNDVITQASLEAQR